ncbi:small subunit processome component 20 homolog [Anopheles marshallii]|uniref:small subunit processome component 20 homolog n=1 Tax=Anopheles marshallii TaxID=1521116 RepID=UPI00237B1A19|nr:small subunit processome component 20 homolog [Anopheles marshallii]
MKNKPQKHKASNAFQFKSFRERINEIDVRRGALYRVETDYELPETEDGTFFQQSLVKWSVQNLTDEYTAYQRGFKETATLPLLLFHKETIVNHLTSCLTKATDDALQPLLELVVALAKDMRKEFRPYFAGLFEVVVQFLYSDSADRVEWTLLCLAHLFKILRSFLRSDFSLTFHQLLPLLDEKSSRPHAIDFATECLGYLVRDLKDKRPFISLMLKCQMQNDAYTFACGRLLFEVLHGVQEQFHTTAKQTLLQLYSIMQQLDEAEADHLQDILTQTVTDIVERIQPSDIPTFWETIRVTVDGCLTTVDSQRESSTVEIDEDRTVKYLTRLLQLSGVVLEHKYGLLLGDALSITVSQLIRLLTTFSMPSIEFKETIVNHIIIILRSRHLRLTQLEASRLTMNVLLQDHRPLYDRFIEATVHCPMFEALIWPNFVKRLEQELDDARMHFLAGLLLKKSPLCGNGLNQEDWKPFPVNVVPNGSLEKYMKQLLLSSTERMPDCCDLYLSALIVLPHLSNFREKAAVNGAIRDFIKFAVKSLQNGTIAKSKQPELGEQMVKLIAVAVETIVHLEEMDGKAYFDLLECLLPVVTAHECLLLNSVHLLIVHIANHRKNVITFERFKRIQRFIDPLLSSYDSTVRRLACAIMAIFAELPELASGMGSLYGTLAQIECIEPLIHTYRGQVMLFQNLNFDGQLCQQVADVARNEWTETVLRYMLSVFAINFKLLWEPAGTVVQTYADNMVKKDEEIFWNVFDTMLTMAEEQKPHADMEDTVASLDDLNEDEAVSDRTVAGNEEDGEQKEEDEENEKSKGSLFPKLLEYFPKTATIDYMNVRIQQLRMLHRCTNFCRSKGDRIVERFFAFLEQDKTTTNPTDTEGAEDSPISSTMDRKIKRKSSKSAGAGTHQVLLSYLRICTEVKPKTVRKHADRLYATYETLVSSRNEEIQQISLNGIFALGGSQLTPYKDFINRLTSDKTLKQALLSVFVPSEDDDEAAEDGGGASGRTMVAEAHRPKVLQLVLKVLDGKIKQNLGAGGAGGLHKATMLTFIGRLRVEELELLLNRWFAIYLQLLKATPVETVRHITDALDNGMEVVPVPPPFRVKTLLNFLAALQTEIAPLKSAEFAGKLMHLKICFDTLLVRLDHSIYRKYKNQALLALVDLFDQYDSSYQWTDEELDAIMQVHVWPQLEQLPSDSIHTPTPLLKLLLTWSQSERLYVLLERHNVVDDMVANETEEYLPTTPLNAMISLLRGSQTSGSVCQRIFTALAAMLEGDERNKSQTNDDDPTEGREITATVQLTGRSRLLIPYVKDLLQYIRQAVKGKKMISSDLLLILTRLAESGMIGCDQKDEAQIENDRVSLLNLMFPILSRKLHEIGGDDHQQACADIRRIHIIIARLLNDINDPLRYLKQLASSLQNIKERGARKMLLQIFENLAHHSAEMQLINSLIRDLNAMDKRWVEQPDHVTRTAAYRSIDRLLIADAPDGARMTGNVAIVFLSQAFHVLQYEKDFAPRQNASEYVCKVVLHLASVNDWCAELRYCLECIVLQGIVDGFKVKRTGSERRNESIQLLGELSRIVGKPGVTTHPECRVFAELWHFTAQGDGAERDFFENITHLQPYKHRKAMKRLAVKLADMASGEGEKIDVVGAGGPSGRTIVNYLLPIVSHYICHDEFKMQTNLVDEAGNCIINLCRLLPWRGYHMVLQLYLRKLKYSWEYQKQLLRIVIGIMDAFHFDLSAAVSASVNEDNNPSKDGNALMNKKLTLKDSSDETDAPKEETTAITVTAEERDVQSNDNGGEEKCAENDQEQKEDVDEEENMVVDDVPMEPIASDPANTLHVAREIVHDISRTIIPNLLSSFNFATESPVTVSSGGQMDKKARFAKQRTEMLKLPIAIAIVKLFMKLPRKEIELNLPKLIIKVITFLKSRLKLARVQARNTLAHITLELGPSYISFVLQNLLAMLTRGFQRHVLTFTVHTIIERAQKHLTGGSVLENILQTVLHICTEDIFGQLIGLMNGTTIEMGSLKKNSMPESKSSRKPYQTLYLLAKNVQERMLVDLLTPFRAILSRYRTHQTVAKVNDALHQLAEGLVANESISPESLLVFVYGMVTGKIYTQCGSNGTDDQDQPQTDAEKKQATKKLLGNVPKPGSIYIIPEEPKRYGSAAGTATLDHILAKTEGNDPAFLECGLEILLSFIRRKQLGARIDSDQESLVPQLIDPIVPTLIESLDSKHSKIICHSINCFSALWSTQWPLKSFQQRETIEMIVKSIFTILHRYNTVALDINNPNFGMVRASFRAIVAVLKHGKESYTFSTEQLRLLVMYIEQDLAVGGGRQTTAFILLRSLLARRFAFAELHTLMKKVFDICVRSESESVRAECRQNIVEYIMNFPASKRVSKHLWFFATQLQYAVSSGRESACLLLKILFQKLPKATVVENHVSIFLVLGVQLVNDDAIEIRTLAADCIETLLKRLDTKDKVALVELLQEMLCGTSLKHGELATQLLLRIIRSEPTVPFICSWLDTLLPTLLENLVPVTSGATATSAEGKFVKPLATITTLLSTDPWVDHLIIQTLNVFEALLQLYPAILTTAKHNDTVDSLAYTAQSLLNSGHQWVRIGALKLLHQIMNELDFDAIHERIRCVREHRKTKQEDEVEGMELDADQEIEGAAATSTGKQFFYLNPLRDCKTLTLDLCAQLTPNSAMVNEHDDEAAALVTQLLFLIANVLRAVPLENEQMSTKKINLYWLVRRVRYIMQNEIVKTPHIFTLRKHALHWIVSVVAIVEQDTLEQLAPSLLIPAVRELTAQDIAGTRAANDPLKVTLRKVASKVGKEICSRLGTEQYDKIRNAIETSLRRKRAGRRVTLAQEKINQPILAARRKDAKKTRTKEARKRKMQSRDDPWDLDAPSRGGVIPGMKRRAKSATRAVPKKRRNMEAMFRD